MKNSRLLIVSLLFIVVAMGVTFLSCEKEKAKPVELMPPASLGTQGIIEDDGEELALKKICGEVQTRKILDLEGNEIGKAVLYNDKEFFHIKLMGKSGYKFITAQMHLAPTMDGIPIGENGEPNLMFFEYAIKNTKELPNVEMKVPLSAFEESTLVTTTAEVSKTNGMTESLIHRVWVEGKKYGASMTAMVFTFTKEDCPENGNGQP